MDVEIEKPHVHHKPTGHRRLDLVLAITALFVSFVSILIAWHHSHIMSELVHQNERIVEAESLPYLEIYTSDLSSDLRTPTLRETVLNEGVGPARIAEVVMTVNGSRCRTSTRWSIVAARRDCSSLRRVARSNFGACAMAKSFSRGCVIE